MITNYRRIYFDLNPEINYYQRRPELVPFSKVPEELTVEETHEEKIRRNGAEYIIRSRIVKGKYLFFTGLIPSKNRRNWFFGNHRSYKNGSKITSLILFKFSPDFKEMTLYFFNEFDRHPANREKFLEDHIARVRR